MQHETWLSSAYYIGKNMAADFSGNETTPGNAAVLFSFSEYDVRYRSFYGDVTQLIT